MMRIPVFALTVIAALVSPAGAQERRALGGVGVFTNDYLGDRKDRWRTAALTRSEFRGTPWQGQIPEDGMITEFRLRMEMIAPTRIWTAPEPGERPFVGLIAPGAFAHFRRGATEFRLGAEAVFIGPQTGIAGLLDSAHDTFGFKDPQALSAEIGDAILPTGIAGVARPITHGTALLRPFARASLGAETTATLGFDLILGAGGATSLFARDPVTGHLIAAARATDAPGLTFSAGADLTAIFGSHLLPGGQGYETEPARLRLRAGLDADILGWDIFYGLTYLGPEYSTQSEGQTVGSIAMFLRF